jgi:nucleoside-diphosphate-sugar epimerase
MKIVVIGGTGHVGTYLVPRLVEMGYEVTCVTRGERQPYHANKAWSTVQKILLDRREEDKKETFAGHIAGLNPDIVIDMICYSLQSAQQMVEGLRGKVQHFLSAGTIWVHGHSTVVPASEDLPRRPFGSYGIQKAEIEAFLLREARINGFPATVLHPGHIVGEGWPPLNPAGHFNPRVFETLAKGGELALPNLGLETVHHVHADDVAQGFIKAITHWQSAVGESFHIVSPAALTLRGYAEHAAGWFGREAQLKFLSWEDWRKQVSEEEASCTRDHIARSPNCSIHKAQRLIEYQPRYSSLEAVYESVSWLINNGDISRE